MSVLTAFTSVPVITPLVAAAVRPRSLAASDALVAVSVSVPVPPAVSVSVMPLLVVLKPAVTPAPAAVAAVLIEFRTSCTAVSPVTFTEKLLPLLLVI